MLPKWHIFLGAVFSLLIWIFIPKMPLSYLTLIFLSSFLIDFDHYSAAVFKTKRISFKNALDYNYHEKEKELADVKKGIRRKSDFHLFHTMEFHVLVGLLSFFWVGFFYIFIGMVFHSLLDVSYLLFAGIFHRREFFLFNWLRR